MTFMIIAIMGLMIAFIVSCLLLTKAKESEPQYCGFMQETCSYPEINNCRNCPIYKDKYWIYTKHDI